MFVRDQVEALRRRKELQISVRSFRRGPPSYLRAAWELRGSARRERFDIVHAHYGLSGWSALAAGGRLVVTFHGTDLRHPLVGPLSRLLSRFVSLPATASSFLARSGLGRSVGRGPVAVLPCGVELTRFRPLERREARSLLGLDPERPYLLFPADPARKVKRYERARGLAARFPDAELLTLHGAAPDRVQLWINASNAVLVTSEHEGFGLAALEALACDVPVLATPVGIAPLALSGLDGTLCAPFEEDQWSSLVRRHVEETDPRVEGRARAALFSSERMADRVIAVYRELIGPSWSESTGHQRR